MPEKEREKFKEYKNATRYEGESKYDIASRIWCVSDAYDEMHDMMVDAKLTTKQRTAGVGALVARVFALACQSTESGDTAAYQTFFYSLGKLRIRSGHFHHAVWKLANWGGGSKLKSTTPVRPLWMNFGRLIFIFI